MTGRELGICAGYESPGYLKGGAGMGRGSGFGGRGFRRRWGWANYSGGPLLGFTRGIPWNQPISRNEEIRMLKTEADDLKRVQKEIEKRLSDLEKEKEGNDIKT
jgi:hypothetical protein